MNVKELRALLAKIPNDIEISIPNANDYMSTLQNHDLRMIINYMTELNELELNIGSIEDSGPLEGKSIIEWIENQ